MDRTICDMFKGYLKDFDWKQATHKGLLHRDFTATLPSHLVSPLERHSYTAYPRAYYPISNSPCTANASVNASTPQPSSGDTWTRSSVPRS